MVLLFGFKSQLSQVPAARPQHPQATRVMAVGGGWQCHLISQDEMHGEGRTERSTSTDSILYFYTFLCSQIHSRLRFLFRDIFNLNIPTSLFAL